MKRIPILAGALLLVMLCCGMPLRASDAASEEQFRNYYDVPYAAEPLAREILGREEFRESLVDRFLNQIRTWIAETLEEAFSELFRRFRLPGGLDFDRDISWSMIVWSLLCLLGIAVVLGLWYAVKRFGWGRSGAGSHTGEQPGEAVGPDSQGLWDQALKTAEQGEYRTALILLFRFVVSRLHEKGLLSFHRGKTNREILDSVGPVPFRDLLAEMVVRFNRVRYGRQACDRTEYEEFLGLCRRVSQQL